MPRTTSSRTDSTGTVTPGHLSSNDFDDGSSASDWAEGMRSSMLEHANGRCHWRGKEHFNAKLAEFVWKIAKFTDGSDRLNATADMIRARFPYKTELDRYNAIWPSLGSTDFEAMCIDHQHAFLCSLGSILVANPSAGETTADELQIIFGDCVRPPAAEAGNDGFKSAPRRASLNVKPERYSQALNEDRGMHGLVNYKDCGRSLKDDNLWRAEWSCGAQTWSAEGQSKPEAKHKAAELACRALGISLIRNLSL